MTGSTKPKCSVPENCALLSVSPIEDDHLVLEDILSDSGWRFCRSATLSSAMIKLRQVEFPVLICERDLPEGSWTDLLTHRQRMANPPSMIVTSRLADEYLWAEALNLGAYDVLSKPFASSEVIRVVKMACLRWNRDRWPANRNTAFGRVAGQCA